MDGCTDVLYELLLHNGSSTSMPLIMTLTIKHRGWRYRNFTTLNLEFFNHETQRRKKTREEKRNAAKTYITLSFTEKLLKSNGFKQRLLT